jgi:phosphatidate cytidylyltransferase
MTMADVNPVRFFDPARLRGSELLLRIGSAVVLAPLALAIAYLDGWLFVAFWIVAASVVLWEWASLVAGSDRRPVLMAGGASVVLAVALSAMSDLVGAGFDDARLLAAITVLAMGMLSVAVLAPREQRFWMACGIPYAGALGIAPVVLRSDHERGFLAIVLLFGVVWATDILAYFVGRAIGGPKLAPRFSPKKTWSGAIGGGLAAAVVALVIAAAAGLRALPAIAILAVLLSVAAQAGDIFESMLKRRFNVKDSSQLIPGHGGLMDRLDGFTAAAALAALIGLARGGLEAPAGGLLLW